MIERREKPLIRIRGIYATALTALFLDAGFDITQPTPPIVSRFKLTKPLLAPPDATVKDRDDKKGVTIIGDGGPVEAILKVFRERFPDIIVKAYQPELYSSYKGVAEGTCERGTIVNLGITKGILPSHDIKPGQEVVVHVRKPSFLSQPLLAKGLVVNGKYMRLVEGGKNSISRHIHNPRKIRDLLYLLNMLRLEDWGIRIRSSARFASLEELIAEFNELKKQIQSLKRDLSKLPTPSKITPGDALVEVTFPLEAKKALDEMRRKVVPTLPLHHYFKSISNGFEKILNFSELLIEKGLDPEKISESVQEYICQDILNVGERFRIIHEDIGGRVDINGLLREVKGGYLYIKRDFRPGGLYDGLNIRKEEGDYGTTIVKVGSMLTCHFYYSQKNELKGIYVNVNTPTEIFSRNCVWYQDLKIDVVKNNVEGWVKTIDHDQLATLLNMNIISKEYFELCTSITKEVEEFLKCVDVTESSIVDLFERVEEVQNKIY